MSIDISDLKSKGFVAMAYPLDLRAAVAKAVASWKAFCDLPIETKKGLPYSNNADGVGYEFKEGTGTKGDRKENFDATILGQRWLEHNASKIGAPEALNFIQDAVSLVVAVKPTIMEFARLAESHFGLPGFANEVEESKGAFFIRFIHYFGDRKTGEETASAHADQSGFTLHLFESDPGLQCLTYGNEWIDMPVSEGETVIIPSMQMQLRSKGELRALCHRVIATPDTAKSGRYSAVCFIQLSKTPKYDKDTHGRLQEKEPGFNYSLSLGEFSKLFKK